MAMELSSKKSTPLWARLISPGMGKVPPPTKATAFYSKYGARKVTEKWSFYTLK